MSGRTQTGVSPASTNPSRGTVHVRVATTTSPVAHGQGQGLVSVGGPGTEKRHQSAAHRSAAAASA